MADQPIDPGGGESQRRGKGGHGSEGSDGAAGGVYVKDPVFLFFVKLLFRMIFGLARLLIWAIRKIRRAGR